MCQVRSLAQVTWPCLRENSTRCKILKSILHCHQEHLSNSLDERNTMVPIPFLCFSCSKSYGPKGISVKYIRFFFDDLCWPRCWHQTKWPKKFSSLDGLSNAVYRLSLRCLVFEISRGTIRTRCTLKLSDPARKRAKTYSLWKCMCPETRPLERS